VTKKKGQSVGQSIGGIIVGFDQQIFRTTPPVNELVAKGTPLRASAAAGGGTLTVGLPAAAADPETLELTATGVRAVVDLVAGGRLASLVVDGHELLRTEGDGPITWGSFPMVPFAGRVRDATLTFAGATYALRPNLPPHAIHGTVHERRWRLVGDDTIATDLGPDWPFNGWAIQRFELGPDHLTFRLEVHGDEPMPASIGWHPYFLRRPAGVDGELELAFEAGAMYVRDAAGIATDRRVDPPPGPWDDCFTDLRRPPVLRWPGFLELTIESDCPDWVIYTAPEDALCVEPQTAPPDAVNTDPTIVRPDRPLIAEMTWRWRPLAG
jgi:galactose mutarotase-like enzyme